MKRKLEDEGEFKRQIRQRVDIEDFDEGKQYKKYIKKYTINMIEIKIINIILLIGGFELEKGTTLDVGDTVWNENYEPDVRLKI